MTCRRIQFLIQSYVDGAAARPERAAVDAHVACCARCAAALGEFRQLVSLLASTPGREVGAAFDRELMAAVRRAAPLPRRVAWRQELRFRLDWRLPLPAMATAGGLAAAVLAAVVVPQVRQSRAVRRERSQYVAAAVEHHRKIERATDVNWDAVEASIELSTGTTVTE